MIQTGELIGDPIGFVSAENAIREQAQKTSSCLISGQDYDIKVVAYQSEEPRRETISSAADTHLGKLYSIIGGVNLTLDDTPYVYMVTAYPSPTAANNLMERLGLRVGEDTLRFTHSAHDSIPGKVYLDHIAQGEFPQSTGYNLFDHDRDFFHAPGIIMMPPRLTNVMRSASELAPLSFSFNPVVTICRALEKRHKREAIVLDVDRASALVSSTIDRTYMGFIPVFWKDENVHEQIQEHYSEIIKPAVENELTRISCAAEE